MRTKYFLYFTIIFFSNSILAQESLLWLTPKSAPTNFNNNQYECPLWTDLNELVDLELLKGNREWIALQSIIVRDINRDGYCDIFSGFSSSEEKKIPFLLFLYDNKKGVFTNSSDLIENNIGQKTSRKIVSADFNADGILDFIAASHPEKVNEKFSYLDVVLSNSRGWKQETLYSANRFNQEGYFHGVSVGDVDNDGDIDIVVANFHDSAGQFTLLNDGQANFERFYSIENIELKGEKEAFTNELFDIDSDGCLDLIYAAVNNRSSIAKIGYGTCNGYFGKRFQLINSIPRYEQVFIGDGHELPMDYNFKDFDKDGKNDLVIVLADSVAWRLVFYKNLGVDLNGNIIFEELSADINIDLLEQGFYTDDSSIKEPPYIELLDINNDGYSDIIQPKFFEGDWNNDLYPLNWVLFGDEDGLYTYTNYPIATPVREMSANFTGHQLNFSFETDLLSNINAYWSEFDIGRRLRGNISEWIIYYSDSTFSEKNSDGIRRSSFLNRYLSSENKYGIVDGKRGAVLSGSIVPRIFSSSPLFLRLSYKDEFGVESPLSREILVEQAALSDEIFSGPETTPTFHTFSPSPLLGLNYNNIGVFDSQKGKIFSCTNVFTNGMELTLDYSLTISIGSEGFKITDSGLFNPNLLKNQNGELPACSGTYETLSRIYADTIHVGPETYRVEFKIIDMNTLEMRLLSAIRIGSSSDN